MGFKMTAENTPSDDDMFMVNNVSVLMAAVLISVLVQSEAWGVLITAALLIWAGLNPTGLVCRGLVAWTSIFHHIAGTIR